MQKTLPILQSRDKLAHLYLNDYQNFLYWLKIPMHYQQRVLDYPYINCILEFLSWRQFSQKLCTFPLSLIGPDPCEWEEQSRGAYEFFQSLQALLLQHGNVQYSSYSYQ